MRAQGAISLLFGLALLCMPVNAAKTHRFHPEGCEFSAILFNEPSYQVRWSGERRITVATSRTRNGAVMRASCGSWYIKDRAAFRAELKPQMERAARVAGLNDFKVAIHRNGLGTVASFWGYRGTGNLRTWYRSDTYIGQRSFLELVIHTHPKKRDEFQLAAFRDSVQR